MQRRRLVHLSTRLALVAGLGTSLIVAASGTTQAKADKSFDLQYRGSYDPAQRGAEIVTVDPTTKRMFIAAGNRIDIVDITDIANPSNVTSVDMSSFGSDVTSVSVRNGVLAAASINSTKEQPGTVVFLDEDGVVLSSVKVGAVPDMVVHSPDGTKLAVAGEGEPRCNGAVYVDPVGTIAIIDLSGDPAAYTDADVTLAGFEAWNGREQELRTSGVRIFGKDANAARDIEPESVTWSQNGQLIWSSLQENNAYATVDVSTGAVTSITSFGLKDHNARTTTGTPVSPLDASDRDGTGNNPRLNIAAWPISGMYQPDVIDAFQLKGTSYLATANEGDSRGDYGTCGGNEEARGGDLAGRTLGTPLAGLDTDGDGTLALADNDELSRFQGTSAFPQAAGTATDPITRLYGFGTRSVSIWNPETGEQVWDSGSFIEQYIAAQPGATTGLTAFFNANFGKSTNEGFDTRSDNKGPEPEGLIVGKFDGRTLLFVGLERANGVMFWDVTDPSAPEFQEWERQYAIVNGVPTGDLAPEGLTFVPAEQSWTGNPLLIVAHEADQPTGSLQTRTSIYELVVETNGKG